MTFSSCTYQTDTIGSTAILAIIGNGSYVNCGQAREFLRQLAARKTKTDLVVDFRRCTSIDSTLLGLMTRTALDFSDRKPAGRVIFANLEGRPLEVVRNLGLHHIAEVTEGPVKAGNGTGRELESTMCDFATILEAHEALISADRVNEHKFHDVIETMRTLV